MNSCTTVTQSSLTSRLKAARLKLARREEDSTALHKRMIGRFCALNALAKVRPKPVFIHTKMNKEAEGRNKTLRLLYSFVCFHFVTCNA
jgi:hypothetical protein